jgi:hypothetical protein
MRKRVIQVIKGNLKEEMLSDYEKAELRFSSIKDIFMIQYPNYELVDSKYPYVFKERKKNGL